MKFNYQIIKYFGPSIMKVEMPNVLVDRLNRYADNIITDNKKKNSLNHGEFLVGDVTEEFKLEEKFIRESDWGNFLAKCVHEWLKVELNKSITNFSIKNSWIVRQFENEYNPLHHHSGHISGAGFLKLPSFFGTTSQNKKTKDYFGGNLQLVHGNRMFLSKSIMDIKPKVGDFYFFPNYLMHCVFPFKGSKEERRSISFNAKIDDDIYNVYG